MALVPTSTSSSSSTGLQCTKGELAARACESVCSGGGGSSKWEGEGKTDAGWEGKGWMGPEVGGSRKGGSRIEGRKGRTDGPGCVHGADVSQENDRTQLSKMQSSADTAQLTLPVIP
eukprot:2539045-Rhodomonas_salina.2